MSEFMRQYLYITDRSVKAGETLDWIIQRYAKRPIGKMTPAVRAILRLGMFQLFFLELIIILSCPGRCRAEDLQS